MFAKTSLVLALVVSLLFVTQARPMTPPVEMKPGGMCAGMECTRGCCANGGCCRAVEQQKAPSAPATSPQGSPVQLAALQWHACPIFFAPPALRRSFVILDEASTAHILPPLAAGCIQLI